MNRRAVFLDRDGTLIQDRHYLDRPEKVRLLPDVPEALIRLRDSGLALVVLSNQSGVARGLFGLDAVGAVHRELELRLEEYGIRMDGIYFCPHHPDGKVDAFRKHCDCRKPGPAMAERAAEELGLKLEGSWVVGDKPSDVRMAEILPLHPILVRTGEGLRSEKSLADLPDLSVVDNLLEAARCILCREGTP